MNCRVHPQINAKAACVACGNFFCGACLVRVKDKNYCKSCAEKRLEGGPHKSGFIFQQQQQSMDKHERIDFAQLPWLISLVFFLLVIWFLLKLSFFFIPALIGALIWLPPFTEWLAEKHAVEIPLWVKIILTVFIIPIIIFGLR